MAGLVSSLVATSSSYLKTPLCTLAEKAATGLLCNITNGTLIIHTHSQTYTFGEQEGKPHLWPHHHDPSTPHAPVARLTVRNPNFWLRLCAMGDLGFSEGYMYGEIDCEDLVKVFLVFLANRAQLSAIDNSLFTRLVGKLPELGLTARILNTVTNARKNISAHYDISNAMFMGFLSKDMTYSCAIFPELDGDLCDSLSSSLESSPKEGQTPSPTGVSTPATLAESDHGDTFKDFSLNVLGLFSHHGEARQTHDPEAHDPLEAAQFRKLRHIIRKADIRPGHRVLEIGSGWGSMSLLITSTIPGTTVDTLTLSTQQAELARSRAASAGLSDRIRVHLMDYRNMPPEWEGAFDRLVSVEMVEAVGKEYMETYWSKIDWALNKQTGVGVVQGITIPEARFEQYMREVDFIRKWTRDHSTSGCSQPDLISAVFPGGFLPTLTFLVDTLTKGSQGKLVVDSVSNIGPHYSRTLREWRRRFEARFEDAIVPALKAEYPGVMDADDASAREEIEVFKRKWIYYYCYCEVGFTTRRLGDHIVAFSREGNIEYGCQVHE